MIDAKTPGLVRSFGIKRNRQPRHGRLGTRCRCDGRAEVLRGARRSLSSLELIVHAGLPKEAPKRVLEGASSERHARLDAFVCHLGPVPFQPQLIGAAPGVRSTRARHRVSNRSACLMG
jgi:hypothetical protein